MIPTFQLDPRIRLAAAFSPRLESRRQFEKDFSAPTYSSMEELADDPSIDAIYISSPHQFHAEQARIAAARGKHILVEKPMALTLSDCDSMIEASSKAGVHLIVGHCHSFDTPYLKTRQIIETGELGCVKMIQAMNYTDFLYRPRRPEELDTKAGGGVVFNQAAHQIDIVRLLAGSAATNVRAVLGAWDPKRPTEGAYSAIVWFANGAFATLTYSGYAHFDTDEWCGWINEMGSSKGADAYGAARKRLKALNSVEDEMNLKRDRNYGGAAYRSTTGRNQSAPPTFQHFGPIIVCCEHGDIRPMPETLMVYGDEKCERRELQRPCVPRSEVIDELYAAVMGNVEPLHNGAWAKATLEVCSGLLRSARENRDVALDQKS